jgi:hypothetical protein
MNRSFTPALSAVAALGAGCCFLFSSQAHASISFAQQGNDLVVTVEDPLSFLVTVPDDGNTWGIYGISFQNVYSTPTSTHVQHPFPTQGTTTMTIPGSGVSSFYGSWERGYAFDGYGPHDFVANYGFNVFQVVNVGDTVSVAPGFVIVSEFFSLGRTLPDLSPSTAVLIAGDGKILSDAVVIPEPAHAALAIGAGVLLLGLHRRRRRTLR